MTNEDRAIMLEAHEIMLEIYRNMAAQIAKGNIQEGFDQPVSVPESAYESQLWVARIGDIVINKVLPVIMTVHKLAKQTSGLEAWINSEFEQYSVADIEVDDLHGLVASLTMVVSKAATANGLPPCCFTKSGEA